MSKQVFEGIKIADFSWVGVGPQAARELAEHGATVVRVESHKRPDQLRLLWPFKDFQPGINRTAFATCYNTNKYGISIDISTPKGKEIAKRLALWADIVTDSMTPGSMKKLGLDYESLKNEKPDIIMYSTCQMGQYGPFSSLPGYGNVGGAMSGSFYLGGWPDRAPAGEYGAYTDFIAPWFLISTLVSALIYRKRTGKGVFIDQSQYEASIQFLAPVMLDYAVNGRIAERMGNCSPTIAPQGAYPCIGIGRWVAISVSTDEEWDSFCSVLKNPEWTKVQRFSTFVLRKQNEDELNQLIGEWTKDYTPEQVMAMMQDAGVPAGVVENCHQDLFNDPQLKHRQHFRFLEHQVMGSHAYNAPSYILSKTPNHIYKAGPTLGEDNEYIFKEILKYNDDEIADFIVEGVITTDNDVPEAFR